MGKKPKIRHWVWEHEGPAVRLWHYFEDGDQWGTESICGKSIPGMAIVSRKPKPTLHPSAICRTCYDILCKREHQKQMAASYG